MKVLSLFFSQNILAFIFFYVIVFNSRYSGGNVGMAPFSILIVLSIQMVISIIIYYLCKNKSKNIFFFFLINIITYIVILCFFESSSLSFLFKNDVSGFLIRSAILSFLLATICMMIFSSKLLFFIKKRL